MPGWQPPRANEIDRKLREDFRRMLREYGIVTQETDPILAVLFRSFAAQVAEVYGQAAETIPLVTLDELMVNLGMPERRARAAQTVLRFSVEEDEELLFEAGTELIGEASSREKLTFALDTAIGVSAARISLVAIYQNGQLRVHQGTELSKEMEDARPSFEAVSAELGISSAIFMAIDVAEEAHLSHHGFYFELVPEAKDLLAYLKRETWCLIDDEGGIKPAGLLRSRAGNGGVRRLEWLETASSSTEARDAQLLPEGFYGGRVFIFPEVPPERRFLTRVPKQMETPLKRIFQNWSAELFDRPRAWLRISLPQEVISVAEDLVRVVLHCTTASNVEVLNQTINFAVNGKSIPIGNGGGRVRHLVKPLSIKGERGSDYAHESEPTANEQTGRYKFRSGRLEIEPARTTRGKEDGYAAVRLLLSNGEMANGVGAGAVTAFLKKLSTPTLEITNLTVAAGGTDGESFENARLRFTELLLSRERAVTYADLEVLVKAFEPKVRKVTCRPMLERTPNGLRRVQKITAMIARTSFTAPDEEALILQRELGAHLQERALLGLEIRVVIEWM
jgi:hypothetical protein